MMSRFATKTVPILRGTCVPAHRGNSTLVIGGLGVAATAIVAQHALRAYNAAQASTANPSEAPSSNAENAFMQSFFARRFYDGPFEQKMTRREAALILGVRESASAGRIKEAHRRILRINHPDMGGSTFLAGKINEAKDLLLKGKT